jgi:hypothetical protein
MLSVGSSSTAEMSEMQTNAERMKRRCDMKRYGRNEVDLQAWEEEDEELNG